MDREKLEELLQVALGALADIGRSDDMSEATRRHKANRIYDEITSEIARRQQEAEP